MEELGPEELEGLVQELEGESQGEEALSPEVEKLLRGLGPWSPERTRRDAAAQLGRVRTSSARIVQALLTACEAPSDLVKTAAAKSLRAPVHQEYVRQYPELLEATEGVLQELRVLQRSRDGRPRRPKKRRRRPKTTTLDLAGPLAATELILLHGDKFATTSSAAVKFGEWVRLVHIDASADARELGQKMLAKAFLAVEQAGGVQLEVRRQQALFGLLNRDRLYVVPGEGAISWPSRSFESELRGIAERLQSKSDKGHNHVSEIIYDWWMRREGRKSGSPWARLGGLVKDGLVTRGLLLKERKLGLKGFVAGESYVMPAETAAMATKQSLEPIEQLLETSKRTRPEVWDLLIEGINKGIGRWEQDYD